MKRTILGFAALAALATIGFSSAASANLVTNGSFETGDFTGWTLANGTGTNNTASRATALDFVWPDLDVAPYIPEQGNYFALLGDNIGNGASLTQTISGVHLNEMLHLVYFVSSDSITGGDSFSVLWNGKTIAGSVLANSYPAKWTEYSFWLTSAGKTDSLQFLAEDTNGFLLLDNVQIYVPEPASIALFGSGLLAAGAFRLRRRVRKA